MPVNKLWYIINPTECSVGFIYLTKGVNIMRSIINFSVEKAITVFMVVIAIIVFGVVSFNRITTDLFPDVNLPYAVVITTYPGATPEEVEQEVTIPLENALLTTTNIREVNSVSQENVSMIMMEFSSDTDMDGIMVEMREDLNRVLDVLPDSSSNPSILRIRFDMLPIMNFSVQYEGKDLSELTEWVNDELSPQLERVEGVASVDVTGGYDSEIRLMIDEEALADYNEQISETMHDIHLMLEAMGETLPDEMRHFEIDRDYLDTILKAQNFSFPAGFVDIDNMSYMVRVGDELKNLEEIKNLKIFDFESPIPGYNFPTIHIADIADVSFVNAEERQYAKVNGVESITISIQKGSEYATTAVSSGVHDTLAAMADEDDNFQITMLFDQGEYIEQSVGSVTNNLILGGILAIIVLFIFLRSFRITFIVGVAIPISLMFAIILIYLSGITLNIVSLGGLALGIGMLVDNSIVVIENIFRMKKDGASNKDAAVRGAYQVGGAITASTLTTIGVFLPIMFIEDFIREIFYQLALTITFSLLASLLIALTFVPTVANRILKDEDKHQKKDSKWSFEFVKDVYEKLLNAFIKLRYLVLLIVVGLFGLSIILATSRGFEFFPDTDEGSLRGELSLTSEVRMSFDDLSDTLDQLGEDLLTFESVESVSITYGGMDMMAGLMQSGDIGLSIVLSEDRVQSTMEIRDEIEYFLQNTYPMFESSVAGTEMDSSALIASGIQVRIQGPSLDTLRDQGDDIITALSDVEGLRDIEAQQDNQSEEIRIIVDKDEAIGYGLSVGQVLLFVSDYLAAPELTTTVRFQNQLYDVYIYGEDDMPRTEMASIESLETLVIGVDPMTQNPIYLGDVATIDIEPGFTAVNRFNGARSLMINADIQSGYNATLVAREVNTILDDYELPEGYALTVLGEDEEIMEAIDMLILVGALGILLVYMIMASQFQSFIYPFIIMVTIPMAFTGGLFTLYFFGMPVSIVAIIGLIILSGVVVNNGIVLVDYINQLRQREYPLRDAIIEAGRTRIRPIFMTALTTILALSAMAISTQQGDELMQPMALTAIGGLIYATFLTIFVVPIMYELMTKKGRYIFGILAIVTGLIIGVSYILESHFIYAGLGFALTLISLILMIFLPTGILETNTISSQAKTDQSSDDKLDDYIKRVLDDEL